jgi:TRAP-type C4-dicarboxylate transport system permease small subunit
MVAMERWSYRLAKLAAWLSAVIVCYMLTHIMIEIVLRVFFARSTYVLDEFVAYATAAITFLCLAYALHDHALIRVSILLHRLQGKWRLAFEIFSVATTLALAGILTYFFWTKTFWRDLTLHRRSESIAEIPLWIPEIFAVIGLVLFMFQLFTMLMRLIITRSPESVGAKE